MPTFIKAGFWEKTSRGHKQWLNLDDLVKQSSTVTLTNQSTIDLAAAKQTLTSSDATKTFTISSIADDLTLEVILNTTNAVYTFPANSLGVSEGVASGDNTITLSGASGDHYIIGIKNINGTYYVVAKNFLQ